MNSVLPPSAGCKVPIGQIAAGLIAVAAAIWTAPATAQVALIVNGEPITVYDIEQRSKLTQLSTRKQPARQDVINELIDDKLKLQIGKRYGLEVGASEVDNTFANIGRRMRQSPEEFAKSLERAGVNPNTLKARLQADIAWNQIVRGKFAARLQVGEKDILNALGSKNPEGEDFGYEYTLRPILFVVARGAPESLAETRKREAEAFRNRVQSCDEAISYARAMRDVVVREQIHRNSADLSPQLRTVLDNVPIGKLTPPEVTQGGVEVFALCGKVRTTSETPGKREARDEIFQERFQVQAKRYLKELRQGAMIEYKK